MCSNKRRIRYCLERLKRILQGYFITFELDKQKLVPPPIALGGGLVVCAPVDCIPV